MEKMRFEGERRGRGATASVEDNISVRETWSVCTDTGVKLGWVGYLSGPSNRGTGK
jgi:hypothetical protein